MQQTLDGSKLRNDSWPVLFMLSWLFDFILKPCHIDCKQCLPWKSVFFSFMRAKKLPTLNAVSEMLPYYTSRLELGSIWSQPIHGMCKFAGIRWTCCECDLLTTLLRFFIRTFLLIPPARNSIAASVSVVCLRWEVYIKKLFCSWYTNCLLYLKANILINRKIWCQLLEIFFYTYDNNIS